MQTAVVQQIAVDQIAQCLNLEPSLALFYTKYAEVIAGVGLNVQQGQEVFIRGEISQRVLAAYVTKACYERGASCVHVELTDPLSLFLRIAHTQNTNDLKILPPGLKTRFDHVVDSKAAYLMIGGDELPELGELQDLTRLKTISAARLPATKRLPEEGQGENKVHWCILSAPTKNWAKKVFPLLPPEQAFSRLIELISVATRLSEPDPVDAWLKHSQKLKERAEKLNKLEIDSLHFTGPGTDLHVKLLPISRFFGGSNTSTRGVPFMANVPTEEVYTTPDFRETRGTVQITRPVVVNDVVVEGLSLTFEKGKVVSFTATRGQEAMKEFLASDEGSGFLGEIALVGTDSPLYSEVLFFDTVYDENAAGHLALGCCIDDSYHTETGPFSDEEKPARGINVSNEHQDFMITSNKVSVTATLRNGTTINLLVNGAWSAEFL